MARQNKSVQDGTRQDKTKGGIMIKQDGARCDKAKQVLRSIIRAIELS